MKAQSLAMAAMVAGTCGTASVAATPSEEARTYFDTAVTILRTHHLDRASVDWEKAVPEAEALIVEAKTRRDTYPAIKALLEAIGNRHSHFLTPERVPARREADGAEGGIASPLPDVPIPSVSIDDRVGMVRLPNFFGTPEEAEAYETVVREGLSEVAAEASCGWLVDLSANPGGNMWPMLNAIDPIIGTGPFGWFVTGEGEVPWGRTDSGRIEWRIQSGTTSNTILPNADGRIAVVIGPETMSSGEMVAAALTGSERFRRFGQPTGNYSTANQPFPMSDGAWLVVTVSTVRDRSGAMIDGAIEPDVDVPMEEAEAAALAWLRESCAS